MKSVFMCPGTVSLCLIVLSCGNGPDLVFPRNEQVAQVSGTIQPPTSATVVSLSDATEVDTVRADSVTGAFVFNNVAYGTYFLGASAQDLGGVHTTITVDRNIKTVGTYFLTRYPSQIVGVYPPDSARLDSTYLTQGNNYFTDSTAVVRIDFGYRMDTASVLNALSVRPATDAATTAWTSESYDRCLEISMPVGEFFSHSRHTVTLASRATTTAGEPIDFDLELTYFADTLSRPVVLRTAAVRSVTPTDGERSVDPATDLVIEFKGEMDQGTVEQAFSITPDVIGNYFWNTSATGRSTLTVRFAAPLRAGMRYTVCLDSTAATTTGERLPTDVRFSFTTARLDFIAYHPLNGHDTYPADSPFVYQATFALDSASFVRSFSIEPPLDSLWFAFQNQRTRAIVYHTPLLPDSAYTIIIDSLLSSTTGGRYGNVLRQRFTAGEPVTPPDTTTVPEPGDTLIASVTPGDTVNTVSTGEIFTIVFADSMDVASVERRLSVSPSMLFATYWSSYRKGRDRVALSPLQVLRSATVYTVVLDSGYVASTAQIGNRRTFSFKTNPVRLTSYYPVEGQIRVPTTAALEFGFNTAIDSSTLLGALTVVPSVKALRIASFSTSTARSATARAVVSHEGFAADTSYSVTLGGDVGDIYGGRMGRTYTITFETGQ